MTEVSSFIFETFYEIISDRVFSIQNVGKKLKKKNFINVRTGVS